MIKSNKVGVELGDVLRGRKGFSEERKSNMEFISIGGFGG